MGRRRRGGAAVWRRLAAPVDRLHEQRDGKTTTGVLVPGSRSSRRSGPAPPAPAETAFATSRPLFGATVRWQSPTPRVVHQTSLLATRRVPAARAAPRPVAASCVAPATCFPAAGP